MYLKFPHVKWEETGLDVCKVVCISLNRSTILSRVDAICISEFCSEGGKGGTAAMAMLVVAVVRDLVAEAKAEAVETAVAVEAVETAAVAVGAVGRGEDGEGEGEEAVTGVAEDAWVAMVDLREAMAARRETMFVDRNPCNLYPDRTVNIRHQDHRRHNIHPKHTGIRCYRASLDTIHGGVAFFLG